MPRGQILSAMRRNVRYVQTNDDIIIANRQIDACTYLFGWYTAMITFCPSERMSFLPRSTG
jgi:hypothetical protein